MSRLAAGAWRQEGRGSRGWMNQSAAVTEDSALWTWGDGRLGRLGHGDEQRRMVPTLVPGAVLGGGRIGRCRGLPAEHALAFAMGTHGRLGAASPVRWGGRAAADDCGLVPEVGERDGGEGGECGAASGSGADAFVSERPGRLALGYRALRATAGRE